MDHKKSLPLFGLPYIMDYLKPYAVTMFWMVSLGLVGGVIDIIIPFFPDYAITHFIEPGTADGLLKMIIVYAIVLLVSIIANGISAYMACEMEMYVGRDLKNAVFGKLQKLSVSYYNKNSVGYLHSRVISDTDRIGTLISWNLMSIVWYASYIVGAMIVMLALRWTLALCVIVIVPLTVILATYFQRRLVVVGREMRELNSIITGDFNEGITGAMTIKTLTIEDEMNSRFQFDTSKMYHKAVQNGHLRGLFLSLISFSGFFALALVLWRGGYLTQNGLLELGTLSIFMNYALGMMEPIRFVVRALSDLITVQVNIERFYNVMTSTSDVNDREDVIETYGDSFNPKKENWEEVKGDIVFDDVTFRYPDGKVNVLEHFNLNVPKGTMVAIVGETGAGKSTLVNLVCRFFEPTSGRILLDGKDLRERNQLWLHSQIGYVLQNPHLFSGTIRENLVFGREDVSQEEIDEAVKRVHAESIIERMENGYDTDVGEGGGRLSAGERQLISIARALIADPALFILDEATSNIDTLTEQLIQSALKEVMKGRTSFIIAHRLSTIKQADIILVVDGGVIIEQGTHKELLRKHGYYYDLYTRQYEEESFESEDRIYKSDMN